MLLTPKAFVEAFIKESTLGSYIHISKLAYDLKQKGYTGRVTVSTQRADKMVLGPGQDYYHHFFAIEVTDPKMALSKERKPMVDEVIQVLREQANEEPRHRCDYHTNDYRIADGWIVRQVVCIGAYIPVNGLMPSRSSLSMSF